MLRRDLQRHNKNLGIPLLLKATGKSSPNFFFVNIFENIFFSISSEDTLGNTGLVDCICYVVTVAWCHKIQMSTFEHFSFLTLFSFDHKTKLSSFRATSNHVSWQDVQRVSERLFLSILQGGKWTGLEKELTFLFRFCSCALSSPPWLVNNRVGSF